MVGVSLIGGPPVPIDMLFVSEYIAVNPAALTFPEVRTSPLSFGLTGSVLGVFNISYSLSVTNKVGIFVSLAAFKLCLLYSHRSAAVFLASFRLIEKCIACTW
jgi:hypothetical protein